MFKLHISFIFTKDCTMTPSMNAPSPVVELRQYTLHPGQCDALIALFELEFIESQEATGMSLMGLYRDHDDENRFVWLRGFPGMPERAQSLAAFYGGPVWQAHSSAANATMVDSDNVMLLRPATAHSGISLAGCTRAAKGSVDIPPGVVTAHICTLAYPADEVRIDSFHHVLAPLLKEAGAMVLGSYVTEHATNTFPRLPVRLGENLFVWFELFADLQAHRQHLAQLERNPQWQQAMSTWSQSWLALKQSLRLEPTPRSNIHA
jgi:quinol monooxygenase YgiN